MVIEYLKCSNDQFSLVLQGESIYCPSCGERFPVQDGIFKIIDEDKIDIVNKKQKEFYEEVYGIRTEIKNSETRVNKLWRSVRNAYVKRIHSRHIECFVNQFEFLNAISNEKKISILEIGCGEGTPGTEKCLENSNKIFYVGVDLAFAPLLKLRKKFIEKGANNYHLLNSDILSEKFKPEQFDIIFGRGILHHFTSEMKIELATRIRSLLKPGGRAFFLEPLNTNPVMKLMRLATKPFRPNLIWEHPFSRRELNNFIGSFKSTETYLFEGFSVLSLLAFFNGSLFNVINRLLSKIDYFLEKEALLKNIFTKAVIIIQN